MYEIIFIALISGVYYIIYNMLQAHVVPFSFQELILSFFFVTNSTAIGLNWPELSLTKDNYKLHAAMNNYCLYILQYFLY